MAGISLRRLLWIDDDAPDRFRHEHRLLSRQGWDVTFATSARAGAEFLQDQAFTAVVLDQMLPWRGGMHGKGREEVWAGCFLLYWLRNKNRPSKAPPRKDFERLSTMQPLDTNRNVAVILCSAYFDDEVMAAFTEVEPGLQELPKPIDRDRLLEIFELLAQ